MQATLYGKGTTQRREHSEEIVSTAAGDVCCAWTDHDEIATVFVPSDIKKTKESGKKVRKGFSPMPLSVRRFPTYKFSVLSVVPKDWKCDCVHWSVSSNPDSECLLDRHSGNIVCNCMY